MKTTVDEFVEMRDFLHRRWSTVDFYIHNVERTFESPVMFFKPKSLIHKFLSGVQDSSYSTAFRIPKQHEMQDNDPQIFGALAFAKPIWARESDFTEMMFELASLKNENGISPFGLFYDLDDLMFIPGIWYEKLHDGDFMGQVSLHHGAFRKILVKYGITMPFVCMIALKVIDTNLHAKNR